MKPAEKPDIPFVSLKSMVVSADVLARLSAKAVNHYKVFPVKYEQGTLFIATNSPLDMSVLDDLVMVAKCKIQPVLAGENDILEAIREHYGVGAETIERMMSDTQMMPTASPIIEAIDESSSEASISHFLNQILFQAHRDKATDIHIEPFGDELRIRYRIDGML
ncbi:MAG: type II/IV secretion system protein, partial [Candidatus Omnitrophica bacterium]|nr:type II/IV secretion system protein [Candidatus Omnitrophota bacterium]